MNGRQVQGVRLVVWGCLVGVVRWSGIMCASHVLCRYVVMLLWRLSCRVVPSAEDTILLEKTTTTIS